MKKILVLLFLASTAGAQRPAIMTQFRHAETPKEIVSLDWVGGYDQLPEYAGWWKEVSTCAGIPLPPRTDSVQFYYVNAPDFVPTPTDHPDRMQAAVTFGGSEQIYIAILKVKDKAYVEHEMLHQVLYWAGEPDWSEHTNKAFDACKLHVEK